MQNTQTCVTSGWCSQCQQEHRLGQGGAKQHALDLMKELEQTRRIDYLSDNTTADPVFSTDYLFGPARGQMFGVLECEDRQGNTQILRAFSCQYNASWQLAGWVPPLFDVEQYNAIMIPGDKQIKALGRQVDEASAGSPLQIQLKRERKALSQQIMHQLHALYRLTNFRGQTCALSDLFDDGRGIPTGAGDCCAPKLLNYAATHHLKPLGLAEFYWGETNRSATRAHGTFYSSCPDKCHPILGFMLCGVTS